MLVEICNSKDLYYIVTYYSLCGIFPNSCWLSTDKGTIFGFVVPMLAVIIVSVYVLL